ncbi:MAG TPA: hypothetical protein VE844_04005, partial [Gammaproteobacteria bacterium]|nr:hypothetical protein [Gammaproteobacteria bacterium]
ARRCSKWSWVEACLTGPQLESVLLHDTTSVERHFRQAQTRVATREGHRHKPPRQGAQAEIDVLGKYCFLLYTCRVLGQDHPAPALAPTTSLLPMH